MIYVPLIGLPPSVNEAYYPVSAKVKGVTVVMQKLTKKGERYKNETASTFSREYPTEMNLIRPNHVLGWAAVLDMPKVLNKTWPKTAENRHKKVDASNRVKLLEDCLAKALGIDDSDFFLQVAIKREGPAYTHVWVWDIEKEGWLPHGFIQDLSRLQPHGAISAM
jgi:hypothetical protein